MSKFNYQTYCAQMRGKRQEPMSKAKFNEMMGIESEPYVPPLQIRPKNKRPIMPTYKNHEKNEAK